MNSVSEKAEQATPGEVLFKKYVPDGIHPGAEGCRVVITPTITKALGVNIEQEDGDKE